MSGDKLETSWRLLLRPNLFFPCGINQNDAMESWMHPAAGLTTYSLLLFDPDKARNCFEIQGTNQLASCLSDSHVY